MSLVDIAIAAGAIAVAPFGKPAAIKPRCLIWVDAEGRVIINNCVKKPQPCEEAAKVVAGGGELPAGRMFHRGGDAHLDPELVRPVRFALADALDLWRVQGIDLAAALAALLFQHAPGQEQRRYECFLQIFIPDELPLDVADDTAEILA
jgi:hypothetical protein